MNVWALDRCMPQFFLSRNKLRGTPHWIILGFFAVCSSMYLLLNGAISTLAGVYTISFLCVMALFAVGNIALKYKRAKLPRDPKLRASWGAVIIALLFVITGLVGNISLSPLTLKYFTLYFFGTGIFCIAMFQRRRLLKLLMFASKEFMRRTGYHNARMETFIKHHVKTINSQSIIFFAKTDEPHILAKACLYVRQNEQTDWLRIVHFYENEASIPKNLVRYTKFVDKCWPKIKIDLLLVEGQFNPESVKQLAEHLGIPPNYMFIACPGLTFEHRFSDLGGVRLITH